MEKAESMQQRGLMKHLQKTIATLAIMIAVLGLSACNNQGLDLIMTTTPTAVEETQVSTTPEETTSVITVSQTTAPTSDTVDDTEPSETTDETTEVTPEPSEDSASSTTAPGTTASDGMTPKPTEPSGTVDEPRTSETTKDSATTARPTTATPSTPTVTTSTSVTEPTTTPVTTSRSTTSTTTTTTTTMTTTTTTTASTTPAPSPLPGTPIVQNEYLGFSVVNMRPASDDSYVVETVLENRTATELTYIWSDISANGYMLQGSWLAKVEPGKRITKNFPVDLTELNYSGITSIDELAFGLRVWESSNADNVRFEGVRAAYAEGKNAGNVVYPPRVATPQDQNILVNNPYAEFIIEDSYSDEFYALALNMYVENKTDRLLQFAMRNVRVNGVEIPFSWTRRVGPGKRANAETGFDEALLAATGVDDVTALRFDLQVFVPGAEPSQYLVNQDTTYRP